MDTKFFHAQVNGRRKRLQLKRIQNNAGIWIEDRQAVADEAVNFFKAQFHEEKIPESFGIIYHVPNMLGYEQNDELVKQPTKEEVQQAVFGLNVDSAGGPDDFAGTYFIHIGI